MTIPAADPVLVAQARFGDQGALSALYQQFHLPLRNYLHRLVGNRATAEDLTQEAFIKAYTALPATRPDLAFKPWLYRIATNAAIDHARRREAGCLPLPDDDRSGSRASGERQCDDRIDIARALARLPPHYAQALLLRHYHGLSSRDTAAALGVSEETSKLRLFRARKAFAKAYRGETPPPAGGGLGGGRVAA